jgi:endonuclease/exonuclease/phosphatase family metal-dependent hydrolase
LVSGRQYLVDGLGRYSTLSELRRSLFFTERGAEIESILSTPEIHACAHAVPRLKSFVRAAQWNIEKGKRLDGVVERFQSDNVLKWADVILLNEADHGMLRSGNVHVAAAAAEALGMNLAFGAAHIELTKGSEELLLQGKNRESLQGNAVLSRHPILEARIVPLPVCFEPFEFHEKRYGRRNCVWARLQVGDRSVWAGSVHLEVRNSPQCRALQMEHILANLPGSGQEPHLLGGDLNSNGFARGTLWRTLHSIERLLLHDPEEVKEELRHPERRTEPLFKHLRRAGFEWEGFNSFEETANAPIGNLEDSSLLPEFLVRYVRRQIEPYGGYLPFKLDWLFGREVCALRADELVDPGSGIAASNPGCISLRRTGPGRISDHSPIFADLRL